MRIRCFVRDPASEDRFLREDLTFVSKAKAFVGDEEACKHLCLRTYGDDWPQRLKIQELSIREYLSWMGRRGGSVVSERKLRHLTRIRKQRSVRAAYNRRRRKQRKAAEKNAAAHRKSPRPKNCNRCWWYKSSLAVRAPRIGEANRQIRRLDGTIKRGDLRREWINRKPDPTLPEINGIYQLNGDLWERLIG